jgi:hypothetical protein
LPRDNIFVVFNDEKRKSLPDTGFNEYTLPLAKVKEFYLPPGGIHPLPDNPAAKPLLPTHYTDAVLKFNAERAKIKHWSEADVQRLREVCEPERAALADANEGGGGPTLLKRIDDLLEIVHAHPKLFGAPAP